MPLIRVKFLDFLKQVFTSSGCSLMRHVICYFLLCPVFSGVFMMTNVIHKKRNGEANLCPASGEFYQQVKPCFKKKTCIYALILM